VPSSFIPPPTVTVGVASTNLSPPSFTDEYVEGNAVATFLGTGREAGADEDDFHTIRRKNAEIDRHEHGEERARKEAKVGTGALTGVVKAFGKAPARPKKVVSF
jgi:zinc finger CCHC domain-containing protein 9